MRGEQKGGVKMKIPLYQVDAFTSAVFAGNPAAVCLLESWLDDRLLQAIAAENNLSETAFLVPDGSGYEIRWFTPLAEVWLCGHATLASAYVLFHCRGCQEEVIHFRTRRSGQLMVTRRGDLLELNFPARPPVAEISPGTLAAVLGTTPLQVFRSSEDLLAVLENEEAVRAAQPDLAAIAALEWRAVIITAAGTRSDFVSRFFAPKVGVPEDPVTGSAHTVLIPYWSGRLGKQALHALQLSRRGGELWCRDEGERVRIAGHAVLFLQGEIELPESAP